MLVAVLFGEARAGGGARLVEVMEEMMEAAPFAFPWEVYEVSPAVLVRAGEGEVSLTGALDVLMA